MAEKIESNENAKANKTTNTAKKKLATGNTKKVIQKRSSSVAGKAKDTEAVKKETSSKKTTNNKSKNTSKNTKATNKPKTSTTKKDTKKEDSKKVAKKESIKEEVKKPSNKKTKSEEIVKEKKDVKSDKKVDEKINKKSKEKEEEVSKKQLKTRETSEIEEAVAKEIKSNKKLPIEELNKINGKIFSNICLAIVIMIYLNFVILGFMNIESSIYITDLKVFSITLLFISIVIFEYAYKKDSGRYAVHGIEILTLAFITMAFIYINLILSDKFVYIVVLTLYVFAIYYVAKSIVIYNKMKKRYFINAMKEIIKK